MSNCFLTIINCSYILNHILWPIYSSNQKISLKQPSCQLCAAAVYKKINNWYIIILTWVNAEHSTYLTALNSFANFSPISWVRGFCLFFANFSIVAASSLKSIWVPTKRNGVLWQWWEISGTHWNFLKIEFLL